MLPLAVQCQNTENDTAQHQGQQVSGNPAAIGVLGAFFRGGQQFLSAKTQSCSAKKISSQGGQVLQFCSAKLMYHPFVSHCSASLKIGQKLLNDGSKTGKNGSKIGKYMAHSVPECGFEGLK